MNKFSMRSLPVAVALTATLAFAAHAQDGVRIGANSNISADVRANAANGGSVSSNTNTNTNTNINANANANASANSDGTVKRAVRRTGNAVQRTGNKVGDAVGDAADATRSGANRAKSAVGGVAARADSAIQNALPRNSRGTGQANVQGSGSLSSSGDVTRPAQ